MGESSLFFINSCPPWTIGVEQGGQKAVGREIDPKYLRAQDGAKMLADHVPFRGLEPRILSQIYSQGEIQKTLAHTNILVEGEHSAGMYIIFEGLVGIYKSESSSRKGSLIKTLGAGSAFGEISLIDRAPRSATVSAEVDSVLFMLSAESWDALVGSSPQIGMLLFRNFALDMSGRLRSLNDDLIVSQRQLWRYTFARGLSADGLKLTDLSEESA